MFLLILDKNPNVATDLIPKRLKFKQLLELSQLICSTGISEVYKPIKQGKELQGWVKENPYWTYKYFKNLFIWCLINIKLQDKTKKDFYKIENDLYEFSDKQDLNITSIK